MNKIICRMVLLSFFIINSPHALLAEEKVSEQKATESIGDTISGTLRALSPILKDSADAVKKDLDQVPQIEKYMDIFEKNIDAIEKETDKNKHIELLRKALIDGAVPLAKMLLPMVKNDILPITDAIAKNLIVLFEDKKVADSDKISKKITAAIKDITAQLDTVNAQLVTAEAGINDFLTTKK